MITLDLQKHIHARPASDFAGRADVLARVHASVTESLEKSPAAAIAIGGAAGIGKSEFLRQAVMRLAADDRIIPIYCNLLDYQYLATGDHKAARAEIWTQLIRSAARQLIAFDRRLSLLKPPMLGASPSLLTQLSYGSNLGAWATLLHDGAAPGDMMAAAESWQGILSSRASDDGPTPVVVVDGSGRSSEPALLRQIGAAAVRGLIGSGAPVLFEADLGQLAHWPEAPDVELMELEGIGLDDAQALVEATGQEIGTPPPAIAISVLERLGGNPKLVRCWTAAWKRAPAALNPTRRAWEAYLEVLDHSPPAERWCESFDRTVAIESRPAFLRLATDLGALAGDGAGCALSSAEVIGRLGLDSCKAEPVLEGLVAGRLLTRLGMGYAAAETPAMRDWIELQAARGVSGTAPGQARAEMMRRLLEQSCPADSVIAARPRVAALARRFSGQAIPPALVHHDQYSEALAQLSLSHRRGEIMRATRSLRLPEVVNVIASESAHVGGAGRDRDDRASMPLFLAYAFRDGVYRRSHEETWIIGDLTEAPTLTSAEVGRFISRAEGVEKKLGPGKFVCWIWAGESVSAEAKELIGAERIKCSTAEQLGLIAEMIEGANRRKKTEHGAGGDAKPGRSAVIPISEIGVAGGEPETRSETAETRLDLKACNDNEVIAAMAAERIAARSGFATEAAGQIKMAVLEGTLNAIEHSSNPEKDIRVRIIEKTAQLEIIIENEGDHFDPLAVEDPDPRAKVKSANKRGWGMKLMRQFMDEVIHESRPHGTRLHMIKRKPAAQSGDVQRLAPGGLS